LFQAQDTSPDSPDFLSALRLVTFPQAAMSALAPLDDLAAQYITQAFRNLRADEFELANRILISFLKGELTYDHARRTFQARFGGTEPVDRIKAILDVPSEPFPSFLLAPPNGDRRKPHQWSAMEDQRLIAGVRRFGFENWSRVARFVGNNRTRSQTSQRWQRGLDPRISRDHWTKEQEQELMRLVGLYGLRSWNKIARELGNRSDVQCRYRHKQITAHQSRGMTPSESPTVQTTESIKAEVEASIARILDGMEAEMPMATGDQLSFGSSRQSFFDIKW
jgi:hypothetical protein